MSTTDGWLKLNFASRVVRKTSSLGALVLCFICNMVFVNYSYDTIADNELHKFHGRPFARVLYVFLMRDWSVTPLSATRVNGRFYKDVVRSHFAHGYYITRIEEGARYA